MRCSQFVTTFLLFAAFTAAPVPAADTALEALIPIKKPRKVGGAPPDKVELKILIPDGVKVVRGAVFNPFTLGASEQKHWQEKRQRETLLAAGVRFWTIVHADLEAGWPRAMARLLELMARTPPVPLRITVSDARRLRPRAG